jgi:hypothetical protein
VSKFYIKIKNQYAINKFVLPRPIYQAWAMATRYCNLCKRKVVPKRVIGVGTLILAVLTGGLWLLLILFYSKRCPICKSTSLRIFSPKEDESYSTPSAPKEDESYSTPSAPKEDESYSTPSARMINFSIIIALLILIYVGINDYLNDKPAEIRKQENESSREMKLFNEVKKIPASQLEKNRDMYSELMDLNPGKKLYETKYYYYSKKIEERDQRDNASSNISEPSLQSGLSEVQSSSTEQNIEKMTTYAVILGRAVGCGVDVSEESRMVGVWLDRVFPPGSKDQQIYLPIFASGMKHHAEQQSRGNSPDSCSSVRREFNLINWP